MKEKQIGLARLVWILVAAFLLFTFKSSAQTNIFATQTKLVAPDARINLMFGSSVAIDGSVAAVGALDVGAGAVYLYKVIGTNLVFTQKLVDPIDSPFDTFGNAVALDTNVLVVGQQTPFLNLNISGQVYVYRRIGTNFLLEQTLFETNATSTSLLGSSVSVSGNTIVAGNIQDSTLLPAAGSANVYQRIGTNWIFQTKLFASDPMTNAQFGASVAVDGTTILVGAPQADAKGAAYVFTGTGTNWIQQQKLQPAELQIGALFGSSVALEGNVAVVGAPGQFTGVLGGAVYIFVRSGTTWTLQQRLSPPTNTNENSLRFGTSVAINNGRIIVGAPGETVNGQVVSGAAYIYSLSGTNWILTQKLVPTDPSAGANFGVSVDIAPSVAIAGAPLDNQAAPNAGAAYIFTSRQIPNVPKLVASPKVLFPPNHKLVPVTIVEQNDGNFVSCRIVSVTSNEPATVKNNGKPEADFIITGDLTLLLRAERSGQARQGRIYTVTVECLDALGNTVQSKVTVSVPHSSNSK